MALTKATFSMIKDDVINVVDYGAVGDNSTDNLAALNAAFAAAYANKKTVYIPSGIYCVSDTLEIPHNSRVFGDGAKQSIIYPHSSFAPVTETYLVEVKQNPGAAGPDNNFFCDWSDFSINANYVNNLGCLRTNCGGGSTFERMYIANGGSGADQVRINSTSAIVATRFANVWFGTSVRSSLACRNGVVISSAYSIQFDNCIFDYISTGAAGTDGYAVKVLGAVGVTFTGLNMEGNPKPFYSDSSGWQIIGGAIYRTGLGAAPSTDPDFCFEVALLETQMPTLVGTAITQGYDPAYGGGTAKIYGGASLGLTRSGNGQINYINSRSTYIYGTVQNGITFGNNAVNSATTLDWYQEGTFTPVIEGSATAGTATYAGQVGRYTRIGRMVFCQIRLNWSGGTGTGNLQIGGLPFTSSSAGSYGGAAIGWLSDVALTASNVASFYVGNSSNTLIAYQYPVGGGAFSAIPYDVAGNLNLSIAYEAA